MLQKQYLQSSGLESVVAEAPSGGQSRYHQSVQTTNHWTHSVTGWDSTAVQMECESTAAHSSVEQQICLMQMDCLQLAAQIYIPHFIMCITVSLKNYTIINNSLVCVSENTARYQ